MYLTSGSGIPGNLLLLLELHCHAAERGAVLSDSGLRRQFEVALTGRPGGFSALNATACLLVLTSRSVGSRASPGWSQIQTRRSRPNTCREASASLSLTDAESMALQSPPPLPTQERHDRGVFPQYTNTWTLSIKVQYVFKVCFQKVSSFSAVRIAF